MLGPAFNLLFVLEAHTAETLQMTNNETSAGFSFAELPGTEVSLSCWGVRGRVSYIKIILYGIYVVSVSLLLSFILHLSKGLQYILFIILFIHLYVELTYLIILKTQKLIDGNPQDAIRTQLICS